MARLIPDVSAFQRRKTPMEHVQHQSTVGNWRTGVHGVVDTADKLLQSPAVALPFALIQRAIKAAKQKGAAEEMLKQQGAAAQIGPVQSPSLTLGDVDPGLGSRRPTDLTAGMDIGIKPPAVAGIPGVVEPSGAQGLPDVDEWNQADRDEADRVAQARMAQLDPQVLDFNKTFAGAGTYNPADLPQWEDAPLPDVDEWRGGPDWTPALPPRPGVAGDEILEQRRGRLGIEPPPPPPTMVRRPTSFPYEDSPEARQALYHAPDPTLPEGLPTQMAMGGAVKMDPTTAFYDAPTGVQLRTSGAGLLGAPAAPAPAAPAPAPQPKSVTTTQATSTGTTTERYLRPKEVEGTAAPLPGGVAPTTDYGLNVRTERAIQAGPRAPAGMVDPITGKYEPGVAEQTGLGRFAPAQVGPGLPPAPVTSLEDAEWLPDEIIPAADDPLRKQQQAILEKIRRLEEGGDEARGSVSDDLDSIEKIRAQAKNGYTAEDRRKLGDAIYASPEVHATSLLDLLTGAHYDRAWKTHVEPYLPKPAKGDELTELYRRLRSVSEVEGRNIRTTRGKQQILQDMRMEGLKLQKETLNIEQAKRKIKQLEADINRKVGQELRAAPKFQLEMKLKQANLQYLKEKVAFAQKNPDKAFSNVTVLTTRLINEAPPEPDAAKKDFERRMQIAEAAYEKARREVPSIFRKLRTKNKEVEATNKELAWLTKIEQENGWLPNSNKLKGEEARLYKLWSGSTPSSATERRKRIQELKDQALKQQNEQVALTGSLDQQRDLLEGYAKDKSTFREKWGMALDYLGTSTGVQWDENAALREAMELPLRKLPEKRMTEKRKTATTTKAADGSKVKKVVEREIEHTRPAPKKKGPSKAESAKLRQWVKAANKAVKEKRWTKDEAVKKIESEFPSLKGRVAGMIK